MWFLTAFGEYSKLDVIILDFSVHSFVSIGGIKNFINVGSIDCGCGCSKMGCKHSAFGIYSFISIGRDQKLILL